LIFLAKDFVLFPPSICFPGHSLWLISRPQLNSLADCFAKKKKEEEEEKKKETKNLYFSAIHYMINIHSCSF
jgi:hypothetical protein